MTYSPSREDIDIAYLDRIYTAEKRFYNQQNAAEAALANNGRLAYYEDRYNRILDLFYGIAQFDTDEEYLAECERVGFQEDLQEEWMTEVADLTHIDFDDLEDVYDEWVYNLKRTYARNHPTIKM